MSENEQNFTGIPDISFKDYPEVGEVVTFTLDIHVKHDGLSLRELFAPLGDVIQRMDRTVGIELNDISYYTDDVDTRREVMERMHGE